MLLSQRFCRPIGSAQNAFGQIFAAVSCVKKMQHTNEKQEGHRQMGQNEMIAHVGQIIDSQNMI